YSRPLSVRPCSHEAFLPKGLVANPDDDRVLSFVEAVHRHPAQREIVDTKKYCAEINGEKGGQEPPGLRLSQLRTLPKPNCKRTCLLPCPPRSCCDPEN